MSGLRLRYRISLAVIAIMLVCCMFLGSSYALWKLEFTQTQENVIKTGCFDVVFEDAENSTSINLNKAYPISDTKGLETKPYKFTIKNNCTIDANYKLYLNVLKITANAENDKNKKVSGQLPMDKIKYTLKKPNDVNETANLLSTLKSKENPEVASFEFEPGQELDKSYILDDGENSEGILLKAHSSVNYELKLWISEDATVSNNYQRFEAQLATIAYAVNTPAEEESAG